MSGGWTFDNEEALEPELRGSTYARSTGSTSGSKQCGSRRAFFAEDDDREAIMRKEPPASASSGKHRDSLTLASTTAPRRSSRSGGRVELVVDDSDENASQDGEDNDLRKHKPLATANLPIRHATTINGKTDELAAPDIVPKAVTMPMTVSARPASEDTVTQLYAHTLVRAFLHAKYPPEIVAAYDKEKSIANTGDPASLETFLAGVGGASDAYTHLPSKLEQVVAVWDVQVHHAQLSRRSRRKDSQTTAEAGTAKAKSDAKVKSNSSSRKKPMLSVTINSEAPIGADVSNKSESTPGDVDFNRLNHPGHTPKAQSALLAAVVGEPGSTPKASAAELKSLGFEDIDDGTEQQLTSTSSIAAEYDSTDSDLSQYAKRKRAAKKHNKHVYIGQPGSTPTKEYVFFRETPPRFVTEDIESAEQVVRDLGGDPIYKRQQQVAAAAKTERFVELQSSDVSKYKVGQSVQKLGVQRNVSGVVSKLYGSRQCGSAGAGTIVIDTWNGSDVEPSDDDADPGDISVSSAVVPAATALNDDDEDLIEQLMG